MSKLPIDQYKRSKVIRRMLDKQLKAARAAEQELMDLGKVPGIKAVDIHGKTGGYAKVDGHLKTAMSQLESLVRPLHKDLKKIRLDLKRLGGDGQ